MAASNTRARSRQAGRRPAAPSAPRRGKKGKGGARGPELPSVANHPRAGDQVRQAKAWGGLAGFALVAFISWRAEVPFEELLLRALAGGIVAYLVVWACAVAVWRQLVVTELRVVREQRAEEEAARRAAVPPPAPDGPSAEA